jgi:ParB family chromosome partitioning protein
LKIEISENENRKEFSFSERMDYAKRLEIVEHSKAEERMKNPMETVPQGTTRDIVASAVGFGSGRNYDKAKYISENADEETIRSLDEGKLSINAAYQRLTKEKQQLQRQLQDTEIKNSDKDLEIKELRLELQSLSSKQQQPVVTSSTPDDYEELKLKVERLSESLKKSRDEASEARNEARGYKDSLETWKAGGRSFDQISLPDFKITVRAFLKNAGPLVYMGNQFKDVKESEKAKYLEEVEVIDRWVSDIRQALAGNSVGANLIIMEGGNQNGQ